MQRIRLSLSLPPRARLSAGRQPAQRRGTGSQFDWASRQKHSSAIPLAVCAVGVRCHCCCRRDRVGVHTCALLAFVALLPCDWLHGAASPSWTPSHSRSPAAFPAAAADPHHSPTAISLIQRVHTHTNHTTHSQPQSTCRNSPQVRPCSCRPPPPAALLLRSFPRRTRPHRMHLLMLELHFRALCRRLVSSQAAFAACTRRLRRSS